MSMDDDLKEFLEEQNKQLKPEEYLKMVTIMKERKVKMIAYLEDPDGDRIELATVAEQLTTYINKHMEDKENNAINTQLYPLVNQMMASSVPRALGMEISVFLLTAETTRTGMSYFGLYIALLMRYITQHNLKIVTEETPLSDFEYHEYMNKQQENEKLFMKNFMGVEDDDDDPKNNIN